MPFDVLLWHMTTRIRAWLFQIFCRLESDLLQNQLLEASRFSILDKKIVWSVAHFVPLIQFRTTLETFQAHLSNLLCGEYSPVVCFCPKTCWADSLSLPWVLRVRTYCFSSLESNHFALHRGQGWGLVIFASKHYISEISVMICCCEAP